MRQIQHKTVAMLIVEKRVGKEIEEMLRELYVDEGLPITHIATEIGVSYVTVFCWLKMCNIIHRKIEWKEDKT
jgi:transposase-like protein